MKLRAFLLAVAFLMVNACAESNAQIATSTPVPRGPDVHAVLQASRRAAHRQNRYRKSQPIAIANR